MNKATNNIYYIKIKDSKDICLRKKYNIYSSRIKIYHKESKHKQFFLKNNIKYINDNHKININEG